MSQFIDDGTCMNVTHNDASTFLDDGVPLGEFLDEQIARAKENEIAEIVETDEMPETKNLEIPIRPSSPRYEFPKVPEGYVMDEETTIDILACKVIDDWKKYYASIKKRL